MTSYTVRSASRSTPSAMWANGTNKNAFVKLLWERGTLYEKEVIGALTLPFADLSALKLDDKERETLAAMKRGDTLIYGGRISAGDLLGEPDLLRKEAGGYIPGDIKAGAGEEGGGDDSDGKPKLHYAVQLALYIDILEQLNLSAGRKAFVWDIHGKEVPYDFTVAQGPKKPETLWDEYQACLAEMRSILTRQSTPLGAFAGVCKLCHWHTYCADQLTATDDLTMIPFLGRTLRDAMQRRLPRSPTWPPPTPRATSRARRRPFQGSAQIDFAFSKAARRF